MENLEKTDQAGNIGWAELQDYINNPELDLPAGRRDLTNPENVRWLVRNIFIRNNVPDNYRQALLVLAKKI